ncbi:uncharacterized protein Pyn_25537 [Prunus yedoensis var. nudiflora]|uniref:RRM domain-containing protein n=1 Tax=Prunus yedoensis var. nudiflora TaxID=2094558 RepID=A0A314Z1L1_PRUYE|nr:uncharacterized protein Pyn_25537 [Prunus yedoensis var. nudiflora]
MENMDDSTLAEESDLNFAVDNVERADHYADEKCFERRDCFNEDLNQHEQQSPRSIHADVDFKYEISEPLPEKSYPVPTESDQDSAIETKFAHEQERTESPFKDNNHYQGEMDELHGSNFLNPSSQSKSQTFHNELGTEDSAHSQESPLTERANQGVGEDDSNMGRPTAVPHAGRAKMIYSERSQYESVKSSIHEVEREATDQWKEQLSSSPKLHRWDNENKKDESPGQNNNPGIGNSDIQSLGRIVRGSISPRIKRQMSLLPEDSPSCRSPNNHEHLPSHQGCQDQSLAPRSHSQHISSPDHYLPPTQGIRQFSHHRDSSALKHISASPRLHGSPPRSHGSSPRSYRSPPGPIAHPQGPITHLQGRITHLQGPIAHNQIVGEGTDWSHDHPFGIEILMVTRGLIVRDLDQGPHIQELIIDRQGEGILQCKGPLLQRIILVTDRLEGNHGFSFLTTERDLERKFSRYGRVRDVRIVRDKRSGDSRGFGFLTLERDEDADAAIRALDETEWNGRIILVEKSKT